MVMLAARSFDVPVAARAGSHTGWKNFTVKPKIPGNGY